MFADKGTVAGGAKKGKGKATATWSDSTTSASGMAGGAKGKGAGADIIGTRTSKGRIKGTSGSAASTSYAEGESKEDAKKALEALFGGPPAAEPVQKSTSVEVPSPKASRNKVKVAAAGPPPPAPAPQPILKGAVPPGVLDKPVRGKQLPGAPPTLLPLPVDPPFRTSGDLPDAAKQDFKQSVDVVETSTEPRTKGTKGNDRKSVVVELETPKPSATKGKGTKQRPTPTSDVGKESRATKSKTASPSPKTKKPAPAKTAPTPSKPTRPAKAAPSQRSPAPKPPAAAKPNVGREQASWPDDDQLDWSLPYAGYEDLVEDPPEAGRENAFEGSREPKPVAPGKPKSAAVRKPPKAKSPFDEGLELDDADFMEGPLLSEDLDANAFQDFEFEQGVSDSELEKPPQIVEKIVEKIVEVEVEKIVEKEIIEPSGVRIARLWKKLGRELLEEAQLDMNPFDRIHETRVFPVEHSRAQAEAVATAVSRAINKPRKRVSAPEILPGAGELWKNTGAVAVLAVPGAGGLMSAAARRPFDAAELMQRAVAKEKKELKNFWTEGKKDAVVRVATADYVLALDAGAILEPDRLRSLRKELAAIDGEARLRMLQRKVQLWDVVGVLVRRRGCKKRCSENDFVPTVWFISCPLCGLDKHVFIRVCDWTRFGQWVGRLRVLIARERASPSLAARRFATRGCPPKESIDVIHERSFRKGTVIFMRCIPPNPPTGCGAPNG